MAKSFDTTFGLKGKLDPSFNGAFSAANKQVTSLHKTTQNANAAFLKMAGAVAAAAAAYVSFRAISGFLADARKASEENSAVNFKLEQSLKNQTVLAKALGKDAYKGQFEQLEKISAELGEQGVVSGTVYKSSMATLTSMGLAPRKAADMAKALGDVAVMQHNGQVSAEAMNAITQKSFNAIIRGNARALGPMAALMSKAEQETWKKGSADKRMGIYMQLAERYAKDANKAFAELPEGKVTRFVNQWGNFVQGVGDRMRPVKGAVADLKKSLLDAFGPSVLQVFDRLGPGIAKAFEDLNKQIQPSLNDFKKVMDTDLSFALDDFGDAVLDLADAALPMLAREFFGVNTEGKTLGQVLGETVIQAIEKVTQALDWFSANKDWLVPTIANMTKAFFVFGGALTFVGAMFAVFKVGVGAIALLTTPIGLVIAAIAALAIAVSLLVKHWDEVSAAATKAWDGVVAAWQNSPQWFQDLTSTIGKFFTDSWAKMGTDLTAVWDGMKTGWSDLQSTWSNISADPAGWFEDQFAEILGDVETVFGPEFASGLDQAVTGALKFFDDLWQDPIATMQQAWDVGTKALGQLFVDAIDSVNAKLNELISWFQGLGPQISTGLAGVTEAIRKPFLDAIKAVQDAWDALVSAIAGFKMPDIVGQAKTAWANRPGWLGGGGEPKTQFGGIFNRPQVRQIAEAGPEAVIPLERTPHAFDLLKQAASAMGVMPGEYKTPGQFAGFAQIPEVKAPSWMSDLVGAIGGGLGGGRSFTGGAVNYAPVLNIASGADPTIMGRIQSMLRSSADDFMGRFESATEEARRLAFE
jgi:hypothetical protein